MGVVFSDVLGSFCRKFISEQLPPIQFKNPDVQVVTFKNITTNPAINVYFGQ